MEPLRVEFVEPGPGVVYTHAALIEVQLKAYGAPEQVELLLDGSVLAPVPPSGLYAWDAADEPEGVHHLMARARRGTEMVQTPPLEIHLDRRPPALVEIDPAQSAPADWDGVITVRFSEPLATPMGAPPAVSGDLGEVLAATTTLSPDATTLEIRLADPFPATEQIAVVLPELMDRALNVAPGPSFAFHLPPIEIEILPSPGSTVFTNGTVVLEARVAGGRAESVSFSIWGMSLAELSAEPYRFVWDTRTYPEAAYDVAAIARRGLGSATSGTVHMVVDRTPPRVVSASPANGEANVGAWTPARFVFSEAVAPSSVQACVTSSGDCGTGVQAWLETPTIVAVQSAGRSGCREELRVNEGLVDLAGNALAEPFTLAFVRPAWMELPGTSPRYGSGASYVSAAMDGFGNPVVAWSQYSYGEYPSEVLVKRWTGTGWQDLPRLRTWFGFDGAYYDGIARILQGGAFYVAAGVWAPSSPALELHAFLWDDGWTHVGGPLNVDPNRALNGGVEATEDAAGGLWVAWTEFDSYPEISSGTFLQHFDRTRAQWEPARPLHAPGAVSPYQARVAAGLDGTVAVAWYEWVRPVGADQHPQVFAEVLRGSTWNALPSPTEGVEASCPEVAVDPAGTVHVAWVETGGGGRLLRVARWSGTEWVPLGSAVNFDPTRLVQCPRLAVEGEGKLVLSRSEDDAAGVAQLWLARWDGSTWIDLPGPLNADPSVLVYDAHVAGQPGYRPAVAYFDGFATQPTVRVENR